MTKFEQKVYNITKRIPRGKVLTYAAIAKALARPRASRAVGNALNKNPYKTVPCHRIVRSDGSVGGFARGSQEKIKLLRKEGIDIKHNKVKKKFFLCHLE